jgi:hypothetical protein
MRCADEFLQAVGRWCASAVILGWIGGFAAPGLVWAEIYKYVDDQGKAHFVDDAGKIPPQYRSKKSMEAVREVVKPIPPPPPPPPSAPGGAGAGKDAGAGKAPAPGGQPGDSSAGGGEKMTEKVTELVEEAKEFLENDNTEVERLINFAPVDETNAKYWVGHTKGKHLENKGKMVERLQKSTIPLLQKVGSYLSASHKADTEESFEPPEGFLERVAVLRQRMEGELEKKKALIEELKVLLSKAGG